MLAILPKTLDPKSKTLNPMSPVALEQFVNVFCAVQHMHGPAESVDLGLQVF